MKKITMSLMAPLLFVVLKAEAQVRTFTWQQTIQQAVQFNPDLQAAQSTLRSSQAQVSGAYSGYLPQLSAAVNYTYGSSYLDVTSDPKNSYGASLTASENIFSGFQDDAKIAQAHAGKQISAAALNLVSSKASYDLKAVFVGLLYSQNLIQLTEDIFHRREANLRQVQLRFENGRENKGSVLLSKAYLEEAKYEHLQALNALTLVQVEFAKVLGLEDYEALQVSGEMPLNDPPNELDIKKISYQTPDYAQALGQEDLAKAGLTLAKSGFFPTLNLTGSTGNTGNQWFPNNNRWSIGANLTFPLFSGGHDYYATRSAAESLRASTFGRYSVLGQVAQKIQQAHSGYLEAVQKVTVDSSFVEAATIREKIAREKYNNGLLTFDDFDIIETDLINRQKVFLQSQRDRAIAEAAWEQAQGKGVLQ